MNDEGRMPPHDDAEGADAGFAGSEAVGSVAEEAMKLFGALSDWAKEHGDGVGDGLSGMAAGATKAFHEVNEHIATGSEECRYCPVCRAVHTVRELSPEVKTHLAVAGSNLLQAAAALMATAVPDQGKREARRSEGVEHIPVDDDDDWSEPGPFGAGPFGDAPSGPGPFGAAPGDAGAPGAASVDGPTEAPPTP